MHPPIKNSDSKKNAPAGCMKRLVSRSFWTCLLCGRSKFTRAGQPHRCQRGFRKRFAAEAKRRGLENAFISSANSFIEPRAAFAGDEQHAPDAPANAAPQPPKP
jgi:hypothetical protein